MSYASYAASAGLQQWVKQHLAMTFRSNGYITGSPLAGDTKPAEIRMATKSKSKPNRELSSLTKGYLISYNLAQVFGFQNNKPTDWNTPPLGVQVEQDFDLGPTLSLGWTLYHSTTSSGIDLSKVVLLVVPDRQALPHRAKRGAPLGRSKAHRNLACSHQHSSVQRVDHSFPGVLTSDRRLRSASPHAHRPGKSRPASRSACVVDHRGHPVPVLCAQPSRGRALSTGVVQVYILHCAVPRGRDRGAAVFLRSTGICCQQEDVDAGNAQQAQLHVQLPLFPPVHDVPLHSTVSADVPTHVCSAQKDNFWQLDKEVQVMRFRRLRSLFLHISFLNFGLGLGSNFIASHSAVLISRFLSTFCFCSNRLAYC
ncbi:hypothetical protein C0J52_00601 [Blattella germanica]|nr:hypothetical protein C0J52_00601 [Blattella germanica]